MSQKSCHHDHSHHHHHHHDTRLSWALGVNVLLSAVQVVAGIVSGSLALVADALHNLSDAAALLMAIIARKIARREPDARRTYGYKKVETLSAYTNYVVLILISLWLMAEAVFRLLRPEDVHGWTVVWVSVLAVIVNLGTVFLVREGAQESQNVRAAYLHNLGDALSSVGVVVGGLLIVSFGWTWVDPLLTFLIAGFILRHVLHDVRSVADILIDGNPAYERADEIVAAIKDLEGVADVHHFHMRALDEHRNGIEAHVVICQDAAAETVRSKIKADLKEKFGISHAFLEMEATDCGERLCG